MPTVYLIYIYDAKNDVLFRFNLQMIKALCSQTQFSQMIRIEPIIDLALVRSLYCKDISDLLFINLEGQWNLII